MAAERQPRKAENSSSSLWIMGTTASAAQQTVSLGQPSDNDQSNGTTGSRRSISVNSFQTLSIHNKAKSIITNKVAPVLITYNCKEEFQVHDDLLKANYTIGRISDNLPEHYLVQGKYFMVCDVHSKIDVLNTTGSHGAPNFRQAKGNFPVFGMGQPSLNGFKRLLHVLQKEGYEEILFYCVREEPVVFLRVDNDFIPYTPRSKDNLHENLHDLGKGVKVEKLELTIRKELYNFAQLNENINHVYNDIEHFKGEPRTIYICSEEDIHVTEEVYRRPIFTKPSCRYHRLPLSVDGLLLQSQLDAFINSLRETPDLLLPQDPKRPPPALVFSCQVGVDRTSLAMILGTLLMCHRKGFPEKWGDDQKTSVKKREQLQIIRNFVQALSMGEQIVEEVHTAIALCSEMQDIRETIYQYKEKLESVGENEQVQVSALPWKREGFWGRDGDRPQDYKTTLAPSENNQLQMVPFVYSASYMRLFTVPAEIKTAKTEKKMNVLQLRSLQYLERYIYLILFNTYLHLEKEDSWRRPFSVWMYEVAAMAGIYEILNRLGFLEFEDPETTPLSRLCYRWPQQSTNPLPFRGEFV
ncbi:paladin-like [Scyliorhinus canicula]|uniref:paladin-like n=1 Tax=Scyliorhinus canicula TaxID=7830 RepID=UPI0018F50189|nr:paladin-like [Scyliorhinus canicula]